MTNEEFEINASNVIPAPRDTILDAHVIGLKKTTWREHLQDEEKIRKFKNPDEQIVSITWRTENGFEGSEQVPFYEKPSDNTKLGKILKKYGDLRKGTRLKILFDSNGYPSVHL